MQCNCGATLPQDARFCHKCGKPQYESDIVRLQEHTREENSGGAATSESALAGMQQPAPFGRARQRLRRSTIKKSISPTDARL